MIFGLVLMGIWTIISALKWRSDAALFPLCIGSFILIMAIVELLLILFGKEEIDEEAAVIDFKLSKDTDQTLANRRTISIFLWILGFLPMILLLGFPIATPLFVFLYLKFVGKEGWRISLGVTAAIWACFSIIYIGLMENPFMEGWIYEWLKRIKF